MGKSAPRAPDYRAAAEETAASNQEALNMQTYANRINQYNPWGSLTYENESVIDPATGQRVTQWTQNQELTPEAQAALDQQMLINKEKSDFAQQLMQRAGASLLREPNWGDFTEFGDVPQAFGTDFSRRSNPAPMYRTPTERFVPAEFEEVPLPDAVALPPPTRVNDPSPQQPVIPPPNVSQPMIPRVGGGGGRDSGYNGLLRER